jgi:hypothetical protein
MVSELERLKQLEYSRKWRERTRATPEAREKERARERAKAKRRRERLKQTEEGRAELSARDRRKEERKRSKDIVGYRERQRLRCHARIRRKLERITLAQKKGETIAHALSRNALYAAAMAAVPPQLAQYHRDDIAAEIIIAVLSGEFTIDDIPKRARAMAARHWKLHSQYEFVSLDAPVFEDGAPLIDSIDSDRFHF